MKEKPKSYAFLVILKQPESADLASGLGLATADLSGFCPFTLLLYSLPKEDLAPWRRGCVIAPV